MHLSSGPSNGRKQEIDAKGKVRAVEERLDLFDLLSEVLGGVA